MKKTYINPSMEVVKIVSQTQMLAGSNQNFGFGEGTKSGSDAAGRSFDFDDED